MKGEIKMIRERKNKNGTSFQVYIRYVDKHGRKRSYSKSGFPGIRLAQRHEREVLNLIESGKAEILVHKNVTFNEVFLEYMEVVGKHRYAISTYNTYMAKFEKHVKNSIGECLLYSLSYKEIQEYFNILGAINSKALNLDIKKIFQVTFKYAIKNEYIEKNPVLFVEVTGRANKNTKKTISKCELELLVSSLIDPHRRKADAFEYYSYAIALYIGYYCGLRISETLALEKEDVDFENNLISVSKRLESKDLQRGLYVTSQLKTECSRASIPMCEPLKEILEEWFGYNKHELICCKKNGDYIRYENLDRVTNKIANEYGFKFSSHMLRHTFSTNLLEHNVSPKTASELARHAQVSTTLDIYVHPENAEKQKAIRNTFKN